MKISHSKQNRVSHIKVNPAKVLFKNLFTRFHFRPASTIFAVFDTISGDFVEVFSNSKLAVFSARLRNRSLDFNRFKVAV